MGNVTFQQMIDESNNIVFFGGAGTSTDCGLPDFRGTNGLYTKKTNDPDAIRPETYLSREFLDYHPDKFFEFYKKNMIFDWAEPNVFHTKLAELEKIGKLKAIITQNVDGLHQKAGSKNVIEIHGTSCSNRCTKCGKKYPNSFVLESSDIPTCQCGGIVRPDVILYGEKLDSDRLNMAVGEIINADMLIVAGTSLTVYPAAGLVSYFEGKYLVIINKDETQYDAYADFVSRDSVTTVFNDLIVRKIEEEPENV